MTPLAASGADVGPPDHQPALGIGHDGAGDGVELGQRLLGGDGGALGDPREGAGGGSMPSATQRSRLTSAARVSGE